MKHTKRFTAALLVLMVVICAVSLTACNHKQNLNPEERPFSMSISTPDGVFNPFFSTSGYDSSIIGLTQIGMINTDPYGQVVVGENEPCVAKDYTVTEASDKSSTTYEFLIKKGIKFSDGVELTIKDVLFNLYVYLDPVYTGAATIYSTDIKGLKNYRLQTRDEISDSGSSAFESGFVAEASERVDNVVDFIKTRGTGINSGDRPTLPSDYDTEQGVLDFAYIAKTFYEELSSDWNAINVEDYEDWDFTEKWQIFFMNDGGDSYFLLREGDHYFKDEEGNYKLDKEYAARFYIDQIGPALVGAGLATRNGDKFTETGSAEEIEKAIKEYSIKAVFTSKFTMEFPMSVIERKENKVTLTADEKTMVNAAIDGINVYDFETVARFWGTATTVLDRFTAEAKTEYFKTHDRLVPTISGITTHKVRSFHGKNYNEEYDVLRIEINGVDPKAIYNFGFTVAPMHYYSTTDWNGHNYIEEFNAETGHFGLEFGNSDFMNNVINSPDKIGLPVGAGPYMACCESGRHEDVNADTFFNLNIVYYERNPHFYTTGENIENAKIKYVRYKVVESDSIINSLASKNIDFGEPTAKEDVQTELKSKGLITVPITTNGYGYVGINPRFVPDVNVRRAIMKSLNAARIMDDYYSGGFGEVLYRPMTSYSWAYPDGVKEYTSRSANGIGIPETDYSYDSAGYDIEELVKAAGYNKVGGVYEKNIPGFGVDRLDYKFTIAGGSKDHPAYKMFLDAAQLLNRVGFDVKVVTSQNALTDLGAGKLEVWAAAWSSTIDPDMFQVYHMDSQASSVKNWGYPQILGQTNPDAWGDEYDIVAELSEKIDQARHTTDQSARTNLYHTALDLVMELAVEFPTYQRKDLFAYQSNMIDPATLPKEVTPYSGLLARIWEINYL